MRALMTLVLCVSLMAGCGSKNSPDPKAPPGVKDAPAMKVKEGDTPEGVKPHYVPCDPAHPEMPCTPDYPPPDMPIEAVPAPGAPEEVPEDGGAAAKSIDCATPIEPKMCCMAMTPACEACKVKAKAEQDAWNAACAVK